MVGRSYGAPPKFADAILSTVRNQTAPASVTPRLDCLVGNLLCCRIMNERPSSASDPEHWLQLKDSISNQWDQLPAEHQASMALVLFNRVLAGEYGPWLRSAVELIGKGEELTRPLLLPIVDISRDQLELANLTQEEIAQLDETDLAHITHQIRRHYANDVFWDELEFVARLTLAEKRQK